jgi:hypothetical protein
VTAVVLAVLIVAALLVLLVVAGLARAGSREMPKPPKRSDRDA